MEYYLLQRTSQENPLRIPLDEEEVIIGRRSFRAIECSPHISRRHASFQRTSNGIWFVKDLNSTNGVYINGVRIGRGLHLLNVDDVIGFGGAIGETSSDELEFTFCCTLIDANVQSPPPTLHPVASTSSNNAASASVGQPVVASNSCFSSSDKSNQENHAEHEVCIELYSDDDLPEDNKKHDQQARPLSYRQKFAYILNGKQPKVSLKRCKYADKLLQQQRKKTYFSDSDDSSDSSCELMFKCKRNNLIESSSSSSSLKSESGNVYKGERIQQIPVNNDMYGLQSREHLQNKRQLSANYLSDNVSEMSSSRLKAKTFEESSLSRNHQPMKNYAKNLEKNLTENDEKKPCRPPINHFSEMSVHSNKSSKVIEPRNESSMSSSFCTKMSMYDIKQENGCDKTTVEMLNHSVSEEASRKNEDCISSAKPPVVNLSVVKMEKMSPEHSTVKAVNDINELNSTTIKAESVSDDEVFCYSQHEEVIVISDDDDYFSIPLSQIKREHDSEMNIKMETCGDDDIEELNANFVQEELFQEKPELYSEENDEKADIQHVSGSTSEQLDEMEYNESENIDNIQRFLNCEKNFENSKATNQLPYDEYFPKLSQAFFSSDSDDEGNELHDGRNNLPINASSERTEDSTKSLMVNEKYPAEHITTDKSKCPQRSKINRTLLTEAKPMQPRPRYQRGREEWFEDRYATKTTLKNNQAVSVKPQNTQKKHEATHKVSKSSAVVTAKPKKPKQDLRKTVKKQMGHRIRVPNGGSAIRMTNGQPPTIKPNPVVNTTPRSEKMISSFPSSASKQISESNIGFPNRRSLTVKQRPERFSSRMEFLVDSSSIPSKRSIVPNTTNKRPAANAAIPNDESNILFKIPKLNTRDGNNSCGKKTMTVYPQIKSVSTDSIKAKNVSASSCNSDVNIRAPLTTSASGSSVVEKTAEKHKKTNSISFQSQHVTPYMKSVQFEDKPFHIRGVGNSEGRKHISSSFTPYHNNNNTQHRNLQAKSILPQVRPSTLLSNNLMQDPRLKVHAESGRRTLLPTPTVNHGNQNATSSSHASPFYVQDSNTSTSSTVNLISKLSTKLDFDSLISEMLKTWNPSWLKEYVCIGKPPNEVTRGAISLPLSFSSFEQYARSFYSLLRVELWESVFVDWKEYSDRNIIFIRVTQCIAKGDLMVLECESLIDSKFMFQPREGSLLTLDLRASNQKEVVKVFAFVSSQKVTAIKNFDYLHEEWRRRPEFQSESAFMCKFSVKTQRKPISVDFQKLMRASVLSYIANKLRLADTFQFMLSSPLTHHILQPSEKAFCLGPVIKNCSIFNTSYNDKQCHAIEAISEDMRKPYLQPKIILLQGPPGTGKTYTIIGIVQALLLDENQKERAKILITAPSNAAVDELGRRLIRLKKQQAMNSKLRIVRVGLTKQIHPDLAPYSLDELTKRNSKINCMKEEESLRKALAERNAVMKKLQCEINAMTAHNASQDKIYKKMNELRMESRRHQHAAEELENIRLRLARSDASDYMCKVNVLKKADVILSTLSSCRWKILETVFGQKSDVHFTCCIVDEATQCTEPEVFQPLTFGISKFILVGDHQQLPATVQSKYAINCNFERSLFERVFLYFKQNNVKSPVFMLTEQYRMHSEICAFPSSHFYSELLVTSPKVDQKYENFPFKPFTVLDIIYGQESNAQSSKANFLEAEFIIEICKQLVQVIPKKFSVGIITPYQAQRHLYLKEFSGCPDFKYIEVNTVDGFQGREKDVIILSCVRARSASGSIGFLACKKRLNVAITRARQCLIICGHTASLKNNPVWVDLIHSAKQRKCCISVTDLEDVSFVLTEMKRPLM